MRNFEPMSDDDQEKADALKNRIIDFIYESGHRKLILLSAVQCVADGLRQLIEEQTGCEVEEIKR